MKSNETPAEMSADDIVGPPQGLVVPPFRTRLVNILSDEILSEAPKEYDSIGDAIAKIRKRPRWMEGMGIREHVRPDIQAQVIDALGAVVFRLVAVEIRTIEVPVLAILDLQLADPSLKAVALRWVPITEDAALAIARRWKEATTPVISSQTGQG